MLTNIFIFKQSDLLNWCNAFAHGAKFFTDCIACSGSTSSIDVFLSWLGLDVNFFNSLL